MWKKVIIAIVLAIVGFVLYVVLIVGNKSPFEEVVYSKDNLEIEVSYCRPYKNDRMIFGEESEGALQPNGKYWRLGANSATQITFSKDVSFAGESVKAGTYRMYAVPGANNFELSLNSETGVYMAVGEPDYSLDVIKVKVPNGTTDATVEQFTIGFDSDSTGILMNLMWDGLSVTVPISQ